MNDIVSLRKKIDRIDKRLLRLLKKRQVLSLKIGYYKKNNNLDITDKKREKELNKKIIKLSNELGLDEKYINKLFSIIIHESRKKQRTYGRTNKI